VLHAPFVNHSLFVANVSRVAHFHFFIDKLVFSFVNLEPDNLGLNVHHEHEVANFVTKEKTLAVKPKNCLSSFVLWVLSIWKHVFTSNDSTH
jgi:hypothetical protein